MFKIGDRVVCVNNSDVRNREETLNIGEIYEVVGTYESLNSMMDTEYSKMLILNHDNKENWFCYRFVSLKEYRKQKLQKLNL